MQSGTATRSATPAAYLLDWRLSLAASMLRAGRQAKLVAEELGFSGPPAFAKAFRSRFGQSPRQWLSSTG